MHRTVDELKAVMSVEEFVYWQAFYMMRPFGPDADDLRIGVMSANVCAFLSGKAQELKDHMPQYEGRKTARQSPKHQAMMLDMMKAENAAIDAAKRKGK